MVNWREESYYEKSMLDEARSSHSKGHTPTEQPVQISINPTVFEKIKLYTQLCSTEMSGMGRVETIDGRLHINSIFVPEQLGSSAYTEISAKSMLGLLQDTRTVPGALCFHWHSHVNMDTFMSSVDRENLREIGENGMAIAMVTNKKNDYYLSVFIKSDGFRPDVEFYDLKLTQPNLLSKADMDHARALVDEKVKGSQVVTVTHGYGREVKAEIDARLKESLKADEADFEVFVMDHWDELFDLWASKMGLPVSSATTDIESINAFDNYCTLSGQLVWHKRFKKWQKKRLNLKPTISSILKQGGIHSSLGF